MCQRRVPRGWGSLVVFVVNVIESFAFYGAFESILRVIFDSSVSSETETSLMLLVTFTAGRLLYPVAGFLGDAYFGRFTMIHIGIWLFWIAFTLLCLSLSIAVGIESYYGSKILTLVFPILTFVLISCGSSAIEVTIIPFGVDQLSQGATSEEQSSYFYWYYFGRQVGNLVSIFLFYGLSEVKIENWSVGNLQSLAALIATTVALICMWWFKGLLFKDKPRENPLKAVVNITYYAATVKERPPIYRRAFRYGERRKPRIEQAKYCYDGEYTSEEVEDVKIFYKILIIFFSLGLCFMTYNGVSEFLKICSTSLIIIFVHVGV